MNWQPPKVNFVMAWLWILAGFGSGALPGLRFAHENWLGGYSAEETSKRRCGFHRRFRTTARSAHIRTASTAVLAA